MLLEWLKWNYIESINLIYSNGHILHYKDVPYLSLQNTHLHTPHCSELWTPDWIFQYLFFYLFFPTFYHVGTFTGRNNTIFDFLAISKTLRNWSIQEKTRSFIISFLSVFHEALQNLQKSLNTKRHKYKLVNLNTLIDIPLLNDLLCLYSRAISIIYLTNLFG